MKTGIIQLRCTEDVQANRKHLEENIARAAAMGAELVVLQELHDSLYFCQVESTDNFDLAVSIPSPVTEHYASLAKQHGIVLVTSLFEKRAAGLYHNTAVVFEKDGSIAGRYSKMHIPDDPAYYEKFYFTPGDLGFHPIQTSVGRLGVQVCWDQWYPEGARLMALQGADILIYPTAIGFESTDTPDEQARQREAWITVQRGHAVANGLPVVSVNRVGRSAGRDSAPGQPDRRRGDGGGYRHEAKRERAPLVALPARQAHRGVCTAHTTLYRLRHQGSTLPHRPMHRASIHYI